MFDIIDRFSLFLCCLALYLLQFDLSMAIIPIILVIIFSCLFIYLEDDRYHMIGTVLYGIVCLLLPEYLIFIPLLLYDTFHTKYQFTVAILPILLYVNYSNYSLPIYVFTTLYVMLSYLLKLKTDKLNTLKVEFNELRDTSSSFSQVLQEKNQSILQNQDYEINLATLNERNRIARELHDNIGHLLSRSLLQVGALLIIAKDDTEKEGLSQLKESLSAGMDDIRHSIHQMHDNSIDLYTQVEQLIKDFTFCTINFNYDISSPPSLPVKHSLIAIIKESMSNMIRHSNGNRASIVLREHPAMYQLIVHDNGIIDNDKKRMIARFAENPEEYQGIGIKNISDRVIGFGGKLHISTEHGFKIFVTIPKSNL